MANEASLWTGPDGKARCAWCRHAPEFLPYHDEEWGRPVGSDNPLFERVTLESFQSGLSWRTILNKRDAFRRAFASFDIDSVARFDDSDVARLLDDAAIVRHRAKILAAINNAGRARALIDEKGSLIAHFRAEPFACDHRLPPGTPHCEHSIALATDLRRRGWKFLGPTTVHSMMEAVGLIDAHTEGCFVRDA